MIIVVIFKAGGEQQEMSHYIFYSFFILCLLFGTVDGTKELNTLLSSFKELEILPTKIEILFCKKRIYIWSTNITFKILDIEIIILQFYKT